MKERPKDFDLSVIVTAHDETVVSGPTMQAAEAAIQRAESEGFEIERLIVLDAATEDCLSFFNQPAFDAWTKLEMRKKDLGKVRNEVVHLAKGKNIAYLDADDLFSENWLAEGLKHLGHAALSGERIIVHPELNWLFDGGNSVFAKPDQTDDIFIPHFFYFSNYYDSLCMAPRQAHLEIPYVHRDIPNGLSFQDWQFSIETMAEGWRHVVARDTIIFKRRRDISLVTESTNRKAIVRQLEAMSIDQVGKLGR
ncbi:glycosyltransferase family A protein [Roseibium sp.]|uniref:glycosyltransferase family A protein n=1 Tax=Roseibium sp. TaxID=1936156 RepID=UPI0039EF27D6